MADVRRKLVAIGDIASGAYSHLLLTVGISYMVQYLPLHPSSALLLDLNGCYSGKTTLLSVFATGAFPNEFVPVFFQSYVADLELDGRYVELALWDTVDQEDYDRLRPLSYSNSHVILICYAIDTPETLTSVLERASPNTTSTWFETDTTAWQWIVEASYLAPKVPVLLVGCKKDLRHNHQVIERLGREHQLLVSPEQV